MNKHILVSVITVSFNSEKTIRRTIESVLNQSYCDIEYIIMDGKSSDDTVRIAKEYIPRFQNKGMKFSIYSEEDQGIYDAMNKGILKSSGDLIGIINSDDWYEKHTVDRIVKKYKETNFDLAYGDIYMVRPNGYSFIKRAKKSRYITSRYWNHPTQFVHRKIYNRFMYRCENMSDDMDFFFRVVKEGYHIEIIHEVLADFRMGGISNRITFREVIPRIKRRYSIYRRYDFSRWYLFECIWFEAAKYLLVQRQTAGLLKEKV